MSEPQPSEEPDPVKTATLVFLADGKEVAKLELALDEPIGDKLPKAPDLGEERIFQAWLGEKSETVDAYTVVKNDMTVKADYLYLPASKGTLGAESGSVSITASWAAGVFPEGTRPTVRDVSDETAMSIAKSGLPEREILDAIAFDITFVLPDGSSVQPYSKGVNVSVSLKNGRVLKGDNFILLHQSAAKRSFGLETVSGSVDASGASFVGKSFSVYTLVGAASANPQDIPTNTFIFWADGTEVHRVILKDGETLNRPENPEVTNKVFQGWYSNEACTTEFTGFGPVSVTATTTTNVYAKMASVIHFTYLNQDGKVIYIVSLDPGSTHTFASSVPTFDTGDLTLKNISWIDQNNNNHPDGEEVSATEDLTLTPNLVPASHVRFDTHGGSAVITQTVLAGEKATRPDSNPTRMGYTFNGWYTAASGGSEFDFDQVIAADTVVHAQWTPAEVNYTIVVWLENADGATFSYGASFEKSGIVGSAPVYTTTGTNPDSSRPEVRNVTCVYKSSYKPIYFYMTDKSAESIQSIVDAGGIQADGNTLVNVYYRRLVYSVRLLHVNAAGEYVNNSSASISFQGRMGEKLSAAAARAGYTLQPSTLDHAGYLLSITGGFSTNTNGQASYIRNISLSVPNASWDGTPSDGAEFKITPYELATEGSHFYRFRYYETIESARQGEDHYATDWALEGGNYNLESVSHIIMGGNPATNGVLEQSSSTFTLRVRRDDTVSGLASDDPSTWVIETMGTNVNLPNGVSKAQEYKFPSVMRLFYSRNRFTLYPESAFGISFPAVTGIPYQDTINYYEDQIKDTDGKTYTAGVTRIVDGNGVTHQFEGWYDNPAFTGNPMDFATKKMPGRNMTIYAKWEIVKHTVTFDPAGGDFSGETSVKINYGAQVPRPGNDPVLEGSTFLDWTYNGLAWDFSSPINGDMTLVAIYSSSKDYHVYYDAGEGSGTVTDSTNYLANSTGIVLSGDALTPPTGQHFVCWKVGDTVYLPGDLVPIIYADVTLTAQFAPDDPLTLLVYDLNYSHFGISPAPVTPEEDTVSIPSTLNNSTIDLRGVTAAETPSNWQFLGWYLDEACTKGPVTQVLIDSTNQSTANVVYAKWLELIDFTVTKVWHDDLSTHDNSTLSLTLYRKLGTGAAETVTATPSWSGNTATYSSLPKTDNDGNEYTYYVTEAPVSGYIAPVYSGSDDTAAYDGETITNTKAISITGTKVWHDDLSTHDNSALSLTLWRKVGTGAAETITATPNWSGDAYTFSNLPMCDASGNAYTYYVTEQQVSGYAAPVYSDGDYALNGGTIKNIKLIDVTGTKIWVDDLTTHDNSTLSLTLWRKVGTGAGETVSATPSWSGDAYTFSDLPMCDNSGSGYTYYVTETQLDHYLAPAYSGTDTTAAYDGETITNTIEQHDYTVQYLLKGTTTKVADDTTTTVNYGSEVDPATLPDPSAYYSSFDALTLTRDSTDPTNKVTIIDDTTVIKIYYTLSLEVIVEDRTETYNAQTQYGYGESASDHVTVNGLWDGDSIDALNYTRASGVNAGEYTNGAFTADPTVKNSANETVGYYVITTKAGKLTIDPAPLTIKALDQSYIYDTLPHGEDNATYATEAEILAKVTVTGLQGSDKLVSVTLDGQETDAGEYPDKIVPSAGVVDPLTRSIVGNYDISYVAGKLTIEDARLTQTVKKIWSDAKDMDRIRPKSLTVELLANGKSMTPKQTVTLSDSNSWTATIKDLPKYDGTKEIVYSWSEGTINGYTLTHTKVESVNGTTAAEIKIVTTTLTNTHIPKNVVVTGDETHLFSYMLAMGVSGLMLAFLEIDDRKKKHKA